MVTDTIVFSFVPKSKSESTNWDDLSESFENQGAGKVDQGPE